MTHRTIRFYEDRGLVTPERVGTRRIYHPRDRVRLALVLRGKRLGFSLAEIREFLDLYDVDRTQHSQLNMLLQRVRARIGELELQRRDLEQTLRELRAVESEAEATLAAKAPQPDRKEQPAAEAKPAVVRKGHAA